MSEAARRTYFHFTPTNTSGQRSQWQQTPPDSAGLYWVACASEGSEPFVALVDFDPETKRASPAGWQLITDGTEASTISLDKLQAWWSAKLVPPNLPERAKDSQ